MSCPLCGEAGELRKSIEAILQCASSGRPVELGATLGLIRIECMRVLGRPGAQAVPPLWETNNE